MNDIVLMVAIAICLTLASIGLDMATKIIKRKMDRLNNKNKKE